jgi:recombination protein RecR
MGQNMTGKDPLAKLSMLLAKLPGVGRRSAERMALKLAREQGTLVRDLIAALGEVEATLKACSLCGSITRKDEDPCQLCTDPRRDDAVLCVVEDPADIVLIERAGGFRGRYHSLMGKLSPMKGEGVADLRIEALLKRIVSRGVKEVILALGSDVESDATISFLRQVLSSKKVAISRLAFGIPAGSEIAYSDPVTLARALEGRTRL